jgi:hypothetical protein
MGTCWATGSWATGAWGTGTWADVYAEPPATVTTWERLAFASEVLFELDGGGDIMPKV